MALTDSEGTSPFTMPVQPMYGGYGNNGGLFGGDGSWLILWLICMMCGGWGGFGMGGGMWPMMMGMGGFGDFGLYPWMTTNQNVNNGFRDQQIQSSIGALQNSVTAGFGDVQTSLCSGFAGVNAGIANAAAQAEISANARQMANMQQLFGLQTANAQGFSGVQAGVADLRYAVSTEACADRAAVGDALQTVTMQGYQNTNSLLTAVRDGIQSIKDELCADRLDAERRDNANLRAELMYARGQADRVAQTADIRASQATTANQLVAELRSCPIPAQPVYGNTPIWTCAQNVANNNGCGCNGNLGIG